MEVELRTKVKRRYFACGINQSLLELARKLQEAEFRVNGRTLQSAIPPCGISAGVSSTVSGGRFQFIARDHREGENFTSSEYINSSITDSVVKAVAAKRFCAIDPPDPVQEEMPAVPAVTQSKKLTVPNRIGPSLWPFLSSIKPSADAEHVKFLEKNQQFYSNYDTSGVAEDYIEPLSEGDFKTIIDSAIDAVLQKNEPLVSQQLSSSKNESSVVPASVSVPPLPVITDVRGSATFEADDITQPPVPKRYAAAVANPRRFQCGLCPYSTNNRSHVRRHHISVHSDARPFRCYVCGKEFARCENAKVHMISRHPDVPYNVDRLRNDVFFKHNNTFPPNPTDMESSPLVQSSSMPCPNTELQSQQDASSAGISSQWLSDSLDADLQRARLDRNQVVPPWLNFPKIEPKPDRTLPVFGHGNMGNQLLEGIPPAVFQAQANTMMNVQSLLGPVNPIKQEVTSDADTQTVMKIQSVVGSYNPVKQEPTSHGDANPTSEQSVCLYCQLVCPNAVELAKHIASCHSTLNPALHAAPISNPGYVVLQTAAPIFLFPYGPDAVMPNRSLGCQPVLTKNQPILPKLPVFSDESSNQNESLADQHLSSVASTLNVPKLKAASEGCPSASGISLSTPEKVPESQSTSTPASSETKRERKRQFKTFYCSRCPDRAPFRYEKSFEKHLKQHCFEDRPARAQQKIASKVA